MKYACCAGERRYTSSRRDRVGETMTVPRLDAGLVRLVAVEAEADPRSVEKFVRGEPLRPIVARRVDNAIKALQERGKLPRTEQD